MECSKLQPKDVFKIVKGMKVSTKIPKLFTADYHSESISSNNMIDSTNCVVTVGHIIRKHGDVYTTDYLIGNYVTISAKISDLNAGWRVTAKKLAADDSYDPDGIEISFHQIGRGYTDYIEAVEMVFVYESLELNPPLYDKNAINARPGYVAFLIFNHKIQSVDIIGDGKENKVTTVYGGSLTMKGRETILLDSIGKVMLTRETSKVVTSYRELSAKEDKTDEKYAIQDTLSKSLPEHNIWLNFDNHTPIKYNGKSTLIDDLGGFRIHHPKLKSDDKDIFDHIIKHFGYKVLNISKFEKTSDTIIIPIHA
jgi:hypothetical protein